MALRYYEDFPEEEVAVFGDILISEDEIIAFGQVFDPKPYHVCPELAVESHVGQLCASSWQIFALTMRMICDGYLLDSASMGANRIEQGRCLESVYPGDRIKIRRTTLGKRISGKNPKMGILEFLWEVLDQNDTIKATMKGAGFIEVRAESGR